jgi:hypothetical protein
LRWLAKLVTKKNTFESDLADTEWLIKQDFSNYSALYHRYLCLVDLNMEQALVEKEKAFVKEFLQIAPNDESLWTFFALVFNKTDLEFIE